MMMESKFANTALRTIGVSSCANAKNCLVFPENNTIRTKEKKDEKDREREGGREEEEEEDELAQLFLERWRNTRIQHSKQPTS